MRHVGVDGCTSGWIAVSRDKRGLTFRRASNIADLMRLFPDAERVFIDIPIGLPWVEVPVRPCDSMARKRLGAPRSSSVFPAPCRRALEARDHATAQRTNRAEIGRSISKQTWAICPKIAEIDRFLRSGGGQPFREVHPELCFWGLAGRKPMEHSKASTHGLLERLQVLRRYEPRIDALLDEVLSRALRKEVQEDDVLDAAVAFVTAEAGHGELESLVGTPTHDQAGLPMEMVYLKT